MKFKTKSEAIKTYKKSFKFYLPITQVKKNKIDNHLEIYRQLYNHCRGERVIVWEGDKREVDYYEQQNSLSQIVEKLPLLEKVNSQVRQDVVRRVDNAWQKFYSRVKENKKLRNKLI
jgi:putative transposase